MKKFTGFGSGMSSYQYSAKKTVWKWTPAKIAAFSMFGIMMAALVYFESTSSRSSYEPVVLQDNSNTISYSSDFEEEYQEFLKQGRKIVSQETLDSLNALETSPLSEPDVGQPNQTVPSDVVESRGQPLVEEKPEKQETRTSTSTITNNQPPAASGVGRKLESVELLPSNKQQAPSRDASPITGTLEEVNPEDIIQAEPRNQVNQADQEQAITEEFYTEETITGRVSALADGTPIEGVEISVKGTNFTAVTDANGKYSITVPGDPTHRTIRYSYHGNATERDVAPGTNVLNIRF